MRPIAEISVLDHGIVALMDVQGDNNRPAVAARTSYRTDASDYTDEQNAKLIRYLIRNKHNTPLQFCGATFYMVMPIFVARQLVRHRTASINEESLRYVEARKQFYLADPARMQKQSTNNKQGSSDEVVENAKELLAREAALQVACWEEYQYRLQSGLAKELARAVLPLSTYTAWYWINDLHNIFHLLGLRLDSHAQYEIRVYAQAMLDLLQPHFPAAIAAWEEMRSE